MRAPLVISGRQVHRPPSDGTLDGCVHEHPYALSTREGRGNVSFRYRGIFTPSINRARRNASNVLRNLLSTYMRILPILYDPDSWDWNNSNQVHGTTGGWMRGTAFMEEFLTGVLFFRAE